MAKQHLSLSPHSIRGTKTAWWYEEDSGICVVQQHLEAGVHIATVSTVIPWNSLRSALQRKDKP